MYKAYMRHSVLPTSCTWLALLATLSLSGCSHGSLPPAEELSGNREQATVVTFNTGTPDCSRQSDAEYTCKHADIAGEWYGTGLAHDALIEDVRDFFDMLEPDIVALQEVFFAGNCPDIPEEFHSGFICESWEPGDTTVAQRILGPDYQIACQRDRPDKCLAVRRAFGQFRGCRNSLCLDFLESGVTDDCGGGARIGRGVIELSTGGTLTVVNIHGSSGITRSDRDCRVQQFEQVFVDILDGSGMPAANGIRNIVLGDINTDPGRFALLDPSAGRWNDFVGPDKSFQQLSDVGLFAKPTHPAHTPLINIDHVASDVFIGECIAGVPTEIRAFDHKPIVCNAVESGANTSDSGARNAHEPSQ
jgi:hypothetical protein